MDSVSESQTIYLGQDQDENSHIMKYLIPQTSSVILDATKYDFPKARDDSYDSVQVHGPNSFHWTEWDNSSNGCELSSSTLKDKMNNLNFDGFTPGSYWIIVGQKLETVKGIKLVFDLTLEVDSL